MLDLTLDVERPPERVSSLANTVPELFLERVGRSGHRIAYREKSMGRWKGTSWRTFGGQARAFATWLIDHGVERGDKVAIVGSTRSEWCVADMGGLLAGAVTLGAYPTLTATQLAYVLDHADAKIVVVESEADLAKVRAERDQLPKVERVLVWDPGVDLGTDGWALPWSTALGQLADEEAIAERVAAVDPSDTAILVYTSGTTGPPKGAMISHSNILAVLRGQKESAPFEEDDVSFNFLPMAHVAERVFGFYARVDNGISTAFASSIAAVLDEVQEVKPTIFGSVPRIFEKAYAKILGQVDDAPPARQKIFRWAEATGREVVRLWQRGERIPRGLRIRYLVADKLVFSKIRGAFGGRVRYFVTGAAPIAPEILELFWAAGFRIYEVYGMTEATVVTHANRPGQTRLGTVGRALPYVEHQLAEDGEVLVRGPMVFQGYYKNDDATAETIDPDGWLHTGDIGEIDADGYLTLKDRKKHIIITAGGKNLTPANIENEVKGADPLVSQVHVHGDRRKYLTALVALAPATALDMAMKENLLDRTRIEGLLAALAADPLSKPEGLDDAIGELTRAEPVQRRVIDAVRRANDRLSRVETIKRVHLLDRELSVEDGELTPTLKVKRKVVEERFAEAFDALYDGGGLQIQ
ncbi:MAG: long-chain fatty acid--CoA ligase [Deltaproteobacteria bacterium]|nr:long-chain fatty acid--CoA ligase [Deltaproteobacteria bacterium]